MTPLDDVGLAPLEPEDQWHVVNELQELMEDLRAGTTHEDNGLRLAWIAWQMGVG